jgi:uncharacterized membrane protein
MVLLGTALFSGISIQNAAHLAPSWGQDLAFFHQLVHSAASGGPWASPLLFEPQGFFDMVHTHLVLPLVVAVYWVFPHQEVLLVFQALFACLALWPAWRLAELCGARNSAILAPLALMAFGPFQGAAMADFRPSVLFIPGILGIFQGAAARRPGVVLAWAGVAMLGRQEAAWLIGLSGLCLWLIPWPQIRLESERWTRWKRGRAARSGTILIGIGILSLGLWVLFKDQMFFHFNPAQPENAPSLAPEHLEARWDYVARLARSGWILGLLSPASLLAMLPIGYEMASTAREWPELVGPAAHYPAFWLPFLAASGIAGACRLPRAGLPALLVLNLLAFPWVGPRQGDSSLQRLVEPVEAEDRVAADYDTIHLFSGREVLWNVVQLELPAEERPYAWDRDWPIGVEEMDVIILPRDHPLRDRLMDWTVLVETDSHQTLRRPGAESAGNL